MKNKHTHIWKALLSTKQIKKGSKFNQTPHPTPAKSQDAAAGLERTNNSLFPAGQQVMTENALAGIGESRNFAGKLFLEIRTDLTLCIVQEEQLNRFSPSV